MSCLFSSSTSLFPFRSLLYAVQVAQFIQVFMLFFCWLFFHLLLVYLLQMYDTYSTIQHQFITVKNLQQFSFVWQLVSPLFKRSLAKWAKCVCMAPAQTNSYQAYTPKTAFVCSFNRSHSQASAFLWNTDFCCHLRNWSQHLWPKHYDCEQSFSCCDGLNLSFFDSIPLWLLVCSEMTKREKNKERQREIKRGNERKCKRAQSYDSPNQFSNDLQ